MRIRILLSLTLLVGIAYAGDKHYHTGVLLQMDPVACDSNDAGGEPSASEAGSSQKKMLRCHEYVLQTDRIIFHIRPKDETRPVLPLGGIATFRIANDKMVLRAEDLDEKERAYTVVSMTPRDDSKNAEADARVVEH